MWASIFISNYEFQHMTDVSRKDQLLNLVMQIVPSQMKHHAEAEACDLLMEVEKLDVLKDFVDQVYLEAFSHSKSKSAV